MSQLVYEAGSYTRFTTAGSFVVAKLPAAVIGVLFAAASGTPTISIVDSDDLVPTNDPVVLGTLTPLAGTFIPVPAICQKGILVILGGTVDCTVFWQPRS